MKLAFTFLFCIVLSLPFVEAIPISYIGNISTSTTLTSAELPATFANAETTATSSFDLHNTTTSFGTLRLSFTLSSFGAGTVTFIENGQAQGDATLIINAITDKLDITSLTLNSFSDVSTWSDSGNLIGRNFSYLITQSGATVGTLNTELLVESADEQGTIMQSTNTLGQFTIRNQVTPLFSNIPTVTNTFAGFIRTQNNRNYQGQVIAVMGSAIFSTPIVLVNNRSGYGFFGTPLVVTGPESATVELYVNNYAIKNITLVNDVSVQRVDLIVPVRVNDPNFPDEDLDGVPDATDTCSLSQSFDVDELGCTCEQLLAPQPRGTCIVDETGPVFTPPAPDCTEINSCVGTKPQYCNANKTFVKNCGECGCPDGFDCNPCPEGEECITDGGCYRVLEPGEIVGRKCLTNNYYAGVNLDCSTAGPSFIDFFNHTQTDINSFVEVHVDAGWFGSASSIRQKIRRNLAPLQLCIDTQDMGCVSPDTSCPGEQTLTSYHPEVFGKLENEFLSLVDGRKSYGPDFASATSIASFSFATLVTAVGVGVAVESPVLAPAVTFLGPVGGVVLGAIAVLAAIGGLVGTFLSGSSVSLNLNPAAFNTLNPSVLRVNYPCDRQIVSSTASCNPYMIQGDAAGKIDLLLIGDGFTEGEFNTTVETLLNYRGNATATKYEGLFTREPFKRYKNSFNIWTTTTQTLNHSVDQFRPGRGEQPSFAGVIHIKEGCPNIDHTFVISKNAGYASDCSSEPSGFCGLSLLGEPLPGRQLLRLAAKTIGGLADEYTFHIELLDNPNRIEGLDAIGQGKAPNCQQTLADAQKKWGNLQATSGNIIGFFPGCGGECGTECDNYLRPTYSSPLRNISARCTANQNCKTGPPYDPFYLANEQQLVKSIIDSTAETPDATTEET